MSLVPPRQLGETVAAYLARIRLGQKKEIGTPQVETKNASNPTPETASRYRKDKALENWENSTERDRER